MKNILVTGGAGFIGSNFIRYILNKYGYNIINYDALTYAGNIKNLEDISDHRSYIFIEGDIRDKKKLEEVFKIYNINTVVHFAAESHVDNSISNPEIFIQTNVLGTQILLDVAKSFWSIGIDSCGYPVYKNGVKFMHVSTDEVYGSLGNEGFFKETTSIKPNSPYSASKASSDLIVSAYFKTFKLPVNISRCSNNYGPYQNCEKLIPLMILNASRGLKLPIYGDGMQVRDWLHVEDHCSAIDTIVHKGRSGEVYNIGGNNEKANIDIVKLILNELDKSEELISYVQDRLGHDRRYAIDNSKISDELNWEPRYTFEDGIKETIKWYVQSEV